MLSMQRSMACKCSGIGCGEEASKGGLLLAAQPHGAAASRQAAAAFCCWRLGADSAALHLTAAAALRQSLS
jgi:hypothetical protein